MELQVTVTSSNVSNSSPVIQGIGTIKDNDIPNLFSPNGDGSNDTWTIGGLSAYPEAMVSVFDRWGQKVYSGDSSSDAWDGTYDGKNLPTADYYYILDLGNGETYNGVVTLKR